jgi:ABC-type Co2+ transport system permease subunit
MISRILIRLATVWAVAICAIVIVVGLSNGTLSHAYLPAVLPLAFGPLVLAWAISWVIAPRRRP